MTATEEYFMHLNIWEKEQKYISRWKEFMANSESVEEFAHEKLNKDPLPRTEDGKDTAERLLCSCCSQISDDYRFNHDTSHLEFITEAMRKYKTYVPVVLFRGVSDIPMEKMIEAAKELNEDGVDFYEKGFTSCSLLKEKASPYKDQLVIYVPPFNHVMYAGHCNDLEEPECRYECIIMRGAKLQILKQQNNTYYCLLKSTF